MVVVKRAEIAGIRMDVPTASPVLLLRIESGPIHVPLWIGSSEASIIALYAEGVEAQTPILVDDAVVTAAGLEVADEQEEEVEKFREFLDQVSADDFEEPGE